jgi:glycerol-3-phosphate dehydrogenase
MPLCTMVYEILYKNIKIDQAIEAALSRSLKEERM